jgi:hypothetical protein
MSRAPVMFLAALAAAALSVTPVEGAGGGGSAHKRSTTSETFVEFEGLAAAVVSGMRPAGTLQVEFGIETPDSAVHDLVMRLQPRLRAACAEAVAAYAGDLYLVGTPPDADLISRMMQERVDAAIGVEGAHVMLAMVIVYAAR